MSLPIISAIVAMSCNRVIGQANKLPWHMPADLQHFKALTTHNAILMGRKTFESIGKPLPNRTNIIMTRDQHFSAPGCIVIHDFMQAAQHIPHNQKLFIIGGAEIYQQLLDHVNYIYLTIIHHDFKGDVYFPEIDKKAWLEIASSKHLADDKNPYDYSFIILERI